MEKRAEWIETSGRRIAMIGLILPLLLIGGLKFTSGEVEALKPMIGGTPWLAWMYRVFGEVGSSRLLGTVEIVTAVLLIASRWAPRAGVVGGALASLTFLITSSLLFTLPIWETQLGGFPALNGLGAFLIKDIALLGTALAVLGDNVARVSRASMHVVAAPSAMRVSP